VARIARSLGALTIGVVTRPFSFEGRRRSSQAEQGIITLRQEVDTLIVIPNDKLLSFTDHRVAIIDAFKQADQVLMQGVSGISDLITTPGLINVDFADVKAVMSNTGSALMGIGSARGDDRAKMAAELAVSSPLLESSINGAHGVLLSIAGGSDLGLFEVSAAAELIEEAAHRDANIIWGTVIDDGLGDEVRVTVIAAGFDADPPTVGDEPVNETVDNVASFQQPTAAYTPEVTDVVSNVSPVPQPKQPPVAPVEEISMPPQPQVLNTPLTQQHYSNHQAADELDVPDFFHK
jgi:cell division protein FtsZ